MLDKTGLDNGAIRERRNQRTAFKSACMVKLFKYRQNLNYARCLKKTPSFRGLLVPNLEGAAPLPNLFSALQGRAHTLCNSTASL